MALRPLIIRFVILLLAVTPALALAQGIAWRSDFANAAAESEKSGKPLLVYFTTDWCGYCKVLEKETFPDPAVVKQSARYIPVKLDAEKDGKEVAAKYKVSAYPTMLIMKGPKVMGTLAGFMNPEDWVRSVDQVFSYESDLSRLTAALKANPSDPAASAEMGSLKLGDGKVDEATKLLEVARKANYRGPARARLAIDFAAYHSLRDRRKAVELYEEAIATEDSTNMNAAYDGLMMCALYLRDDALALKIAKRIAESKQVSDKLRMQGVTFLKADVMAKELKSPEALVTFLMKQLQGTEKRDGYQLTGLFINDAVILRLLRGQFGAAYNLMTKDDMERSMGLDKLKTVFRETSRTITKNVMSAQVVIKFESKVTIKEEVTTSTGYISLQLFDQDGRWYITSLTLEYDPS